MLTNKLRQIFAINIFSKYTFTYFYIIFKINKTKYILAMNGYFYEDPLNISRIGGLIGNKNKELNKLLNNSKLEINNKFKSIIIIKTKLEPRLKI